MLTVMIVGLAKGSTVMISRHIGEKKNDKVAKSVGNTIVIFMSISIVITAILLCLTKPIVSVMAMPEEAVNGTINYLIVCFIGIPFITAYNIISSIFRGLGDTKSPMYFIAVACVCNIALDFLFSKTMKINEGEVPQYYVENSHPAIIDPEEWKKVQEEYQRRKEAVKRTACHSPFAGKVICGDCGEWFGPKVWHSNSQYRRLIWQCNHKFKGGEKCATPHLTEDALKEYTRQALSFLIENREALIEDGRLIKQALSDHTEIDAELRAIVEEMEVVAGLIEKSIATNAITALGQDEYAKSYESLTERYQGLQKHYTALTKQRADKEYKADVLSCFLFELGELELLDTEWSDSRFHAIVERITVYNDGRLVFTFRNGSEETVMM